MEQRCTDNERKPCSYLQSPILYKHFINLLCLVQAQSDDDDEAGENVPMTMNADGSKFMEEFFEQVNFSRYFFVYQHIEHIAQFSCAQELCFNFSLTLQEYTG